jgi:hypothetical protein
MRWASRLLVTAGVAGGLLFAGCNTGSSIEADALNDLGVDTAEVENVGGFCHGEPDGTPCDDGKLCTEDDRCGLGVCRGKPVEAELACDDGDACTGNDRCQAGACRGDAALLDCGALDGPCARGACDPASGECLSEPLPEGSACDDEDPCTHRDVCGRLDGALICAGEALVCEEPESPCLRAVCDPAVEGCVLIPIPDDEAPACDDEDPCTTGDHCEEGACLGEPVPLDCVDPQDACNEAQCDPATGQCVAAPVADGVTCDDGDACTIADHCMDGGCVGDPGAQDCQAQAGPCETGACDPVTGACVFTALEEGSACDDGDLCTPASTCVLVDDQIACVGAPTDCSALDEVCSRGVCDPATGACVLTPIPEEEGAICDDDDRCTEGDHCAGGACVGVPIDLDCSGLTSACTQGACDPGTGECVALLRDDGVSCVDGDLCTSGDQCLSGVCVGAPVALDCGDLDGVCAVGRCDPTTGACAAAPDEIGAACDDGNPCTVDGACALVEDALICVSAERDCAELDDDCNLGVCDPETGACEAVPIASEEPLACEDGDLCTTGDVCIDGACEGAAVDCSVLDVGCERGRCDPTTGGCEAEPRPEGSDCDDQDPCTGADRCVFGVCDGVEVCAPCDYKAAGDACDDGNPCTTAGVCTLEEDALKCLGLGTDCTGLDDACNRGACDPDNGACRAVPIPPEDGPVCDDGNACTVNDRCDDGDCLSDPLDLDCSGLADTCNAAACDPNSGQCVAYPFADGTACDDEDGCTEQDQCQAGICESVPVELDCVAFDGPCSIGECVPATGACAATPLPVDTPCDDSDPCTDESACALVGEVTMCQGEARDCTAWDDACNQGACDGDSGACVAVPIPPEEGPVCDDADLCTSGDRCEEGACVGDPLELDCAYLIDPCNAAGCDPATGDCAAWPFADETGCDDGNACTEDGACLAGVCVSQPIDLDCAYLQDTCNGSACHPGTGLCVAIPHDDGSGCDDEDPCTDDDTCVMGVCHGVTLDCSVLDTACSLGVCDPTDGACGFETLEDGNPCDDEDPCTGGDQCEQGVCVGGSDVCTSCEMKLVGDDCDDDNPCTSAESCQVVDGDMNCVGVQMDCSDHDEGCLMGVCDPASGACVQVGQPTGTPCSDEDDCTHDDACADGACVGLAYPTCGEAVSACEPPASAGSSEAAALVGLTGGEATLLGLMAGQTDSDWYAVDVLAGQLLSVETRANCLWALARVYRARDRSGAARPL